MAESGFPGQHTTTTTVTSSTVVQTNIRFDPSYLSTVPGMLKVAQILFSILGFICIQVSGFKIYSQGRYFSWISMIAFWFSLVLLGLYLFHIVEKFYKIPWLKIEFGFCALWSFLYLVAGSVAASFGSTYSESAFSAAAFFGFAAMLVYAIDAYLKWVAGRTGGLAQGTRVVSKQTTSEVNAPPPAARY